MFTLILLLSSEISDGDFLKFNIQCYRKQTCTDTDTAETWTHPASGVSVRLQEGTDFIFVGPHIRFNGTIPNFTWDEDASPQNNIINLSNYFQCSFGSNEIFQHWDTTLKYDVEGNSVFQITITPDGWVSVSWPDDWCGSEQVRFYAYNVFGEKRYSNIVTLTVNCCRKLKITEVGFGATDIQWVEIYLDPTSTLSANLKDYKLSDLDGEASETTLATSNVTLNPGDYVLVHFSSGTDEVDPWTPFGANDFNSNGVRDLYTDDTPPSCAEDQIVLISSGGCYRDAACWSNYSGAWATGEDTDVSTLISNNAWTDYDNDESVEEEDCWGDTDNVVAGWSIARRFSASLDYFDTNSKDDWLIDKNPTAGYPNWKILSSHLTVTDQADRVYRRAICVLLKVQIPDIWDFSSSETLQGIKIANSGNLTNSDFEWIRVYADDGDDFFNPFNVNVDGSVPDALLGTMTYNASGWWELTGLSFSIPADGSVTLWIAGKLADSATIGGTLDFYLTRNDGIKISVSNGEPTGPVDASARNPTSRTVSDVEVVLNEVLYNSDESTEGHYEFFEIYNIGSASCNPTWEGTNPLSWKVYDSNSGDEIYFYDEPPWNETSSILPAGGIAVIFPANTDTTAANPSYAKYNELVPASGVVLRVGDATLSANDYIGNGLANTLDGVWVCDGATYVCWKYWTSDITGDGYSTELEDPLGTTWVVSSSLRGTPGAYNGARVDEIAMYAVSSTYAGEGDVNVLVFDFEIKNGNSFNWTLTDVTVENLGTATSSEITLKLWEDGASAGWDGDEAQIGTFTYDAGNDDYDINGLSITIPAAGSKRLFITIDVASSVVDNHTVRIKLPQINLPAPYSHSAIIKGLRFAEFQDGPVNGSIENPNDIILDHGIPSAPANFIARAHADEIGDPSDYVELTWSEPTTNTDGTSLTDLDHYEVWRTFANSTPSVPSSWSLLASLPPGTTSYNDSSVANGNSYYYKIRAVDDSGNYSETIYTTAPVIKVSKQVSPVYSLPFDQLTYTIYFTNWGYGPAENLVILEVLNTADVEFVNATAPSVYSATIEYYYSGTWNAAPSSATEKIRWVFSESIPPGTVEWQDSISFIVRVK